MIAAIQKFLKDLGYSVSEEAYQIIEACDDWYRAKITDAHKRTTVNGEEYTLERMGFGRRAAADDANLCEIIEINAGGDSEEQFDFVNSVFEQNRFNTQYRRQLEIMAAEGTVACYVWLDNATLYDDGSIRGGDIRLNYVNALGFVPLTINNNEVIEAAFIGETFTNTKKEHILVLCRLDGGKYSYTVRVFDENGKPIPDKSQDVILGEIKPFSVMRTAQENTFENMQGFGMPKLFNVIPVLKGLDAAFTALIGDLDSAEKITLINELLCGFDDTGKPITPNAAMKRRFVMLGEKLPQDKDLVHEINPVIRIEEFRDAIEMLLNLMSQQFGYGTKKYVLDPSGSLMTATQYVGERQEQLQELNRQRFEAREYISGIVKAILWFANTYHNQNWNMDADVLIEFDDSVVVNREAQLEAMRNDVLSGLGGPYLRALYLQQKYNLDESEAMKWAQMNDPDANSEPED